MAVWARLWGGQNARVQQTMAEIEARLSCPSLKPGEITWLSADELKAYSARCQSRSQDWTASDQAALERRIARMIKRYGPAREAGA